MGFRRILAVTQSGLFMPGMTAKTLFLDFDGVLHPGMAREEQFFMHGERLASVIAGASCDIVISSSWRFHHSFGALSNRLPDPLAEKIVGITGDAHVGAHARYQEILAYVKRHRCVDWRALDDSRFEFPSGVPELILCDGATGLDDRVLLQIAQWLRA